MSEFIRPLLISHFICRSWQSHKEERAIAAIVQKREAVFIQVACLGRDRVFWLPFASLCALHYSPYCVGCTNLPKMLIFSVYISFWEKEVVLRNPLKKMQKAKENKCHLKNLDCTRNGLQLPLAKPSYQVPYALLGIWHKLPITFSISEGAGWWCSISSHLWPPPFPSGK